MMNKITLFRTTPRIVMGPGAIGQIGQEASNLSGKKVLIVTDKGLIGAGLIQPVEKSLKESRI
ncbi:MAG: iron-containing alcohol dehydrogenase, partial [Thermodesulfobacteriota bacterium]